MNTKQIPNPVKELSSNGANGTFSFIATIRFEIDSETAANLLVESNPSKTVHEWLLTQKPKDDHDYSGNAGALRTEHGRYLSDKAVAQARLLLPEGDPMKPPF